MAEMKNILGNPPKVFGAFYRIVPCGEESEMKGEYQMKTQVSKEQDLLFAQGRVTDGPIVTYKRGGESIHNTMPSRAIDLAPWVPGRGIAWDDEVLFGEMAGVIMYCAWKRSIPIEWGGHWSSFKDRPHFQVPERGYPGGI